MMALEREQQMQMRQQKMLMLQHQSRRKIEFTQQRCEVLSEIDRVSVKSLHHSSKVFKGTHSSKLGTSSIEPRTEVSIGDGNLKSIAAMGEYTLGYTSLSQVEAKRPLQNIPMASIGRHGSSQRPELVSGQPVFSTSPSSVLHR